MEIPTISFGDASLLYTTSSLTKIPSWSSKRYSLSVPVSIYQSILKFPLKLSVSLLYAAVSVFKCIRSGYCPTYALEDEISDLKVKAANIEYYQTETEALTEKIGAVLKKFGPGVTPEKSIRFFVELARAASTLLSAYLSASVPGTAPHMQSRFSNPDKSYCKPHYTLPNTGCTVFLPRLSG